MLWKHWVARATTPYEPFKNFDSARWFWRRMTSVFPEILSAVLMPNHLHVILPGHVNGTRKMGGLLSAMSVHCKIKNLWQAHSEPTDIPDIHHLRRQIRYIALNPCRKKLCHDPLEWYWSTYRDTLGATIESAPLAQRLAPILQDSDHQFEVRFHHYISSDPSVHVAGTAFPKASIPKTFPEQSIGEILCAASASLRMRPHAVQERGPLRSVFIHLAYRQGWRRPSVLAQICKMTPDGVHRILRQNCPERITAAELCLGDGRLRREQGSIADLLTNSR